MPADHVSADRSRSQEVNQLSERRLRREVRDRRVRSAATDPLRAPCPGATALTLRLVIFKRVGDGRPYPAHGLSQREWSSVPPTQVRLAELVTTKGQLDLATLLDEDSTYFGDLFAHVVAWRDDLYLEDGLHRALRAALQQRQVLHARILALPEGAPR